MNSFKAKNGMVFSIRKAVEGDSSNIVEFYNFIGGETDNLSFGKNEYPLSIEEQTSAIKKRNQDTDSLMLIAEYENEIAGIITLDTPVKRKFKHNACLGIGIKLKFCGIGLGQEMMRQTVEFAKNSVTTHKINLVTRSDNENAINVYKKFGFVIEGILKNETFENEKYYDSIVMGLFF